MVTITRLLEFDYGHRVLGHESRCAHIHGHRGKVELTVTAPDLDPLGRVIDFSVLKSVVGKWIDDNWDHNILLNERDPLLDVPPESSIWGGKKPYIVASANPTAEVMARILYKVATELLYRHGIAVVKVRMHETPNCFADYDGK